MFLIAWWTGKGFYTLLITLAAGLLVGLVLHAAGVDTRGDNLLWAIALVLAAAVNWRVGAHFNGKRRKTFGPMTWRRRFTYRARHRFMSLPMESWSLAMLAFAVILAITAPFQR